MQDPLWTPAADWRRTSARARVVLQGLNDIGRARGISANRCQRFTEGAGKHIDLVLQLEMSGVAAKAHERQKVRAGTAREAALGHKLERLCRYIARPALSPSAAAELEFDGVAYGCEARVWYIERFGHINVQWQADTLKAEVDCEKS